MINSFHNLCTTLEKLSSTTSRIESTEILSEYIKSISHLPSSLLASLYLTTSTFYPDYCNIELSLGESAAYKLVSIITGHKNATLKAKLLKTDLGTIAMQNKQSSLFISTVKISVDEVLHNFRCIANMDSGKNRFKRMVKMMVQCEGVEVKYLIRMVEGKLKIGIAMQTILSSLASGFAMFVQSRNVVCNLSNNVNIEKCEEPVLKSENNKRVKKCGNIFQFFDRKINDENSDVNFDIKVDREIETGNIIYKHNNGSIIIGDNIITFEDIMGDNLNYMNALVNKSTLYYNKNHIDTDCMKTYIQNVKLAYSHCPILDALVFSLYKYGPLDLHKHLLIMPGIPVKPMLARPSKTLTEAYSRVSSNFAVEYKYDGERAQIHKFNNQYKIFSRNSENLTIKYPEIPEILSQTCKYQANFILDCEIVAYCLDTNTILPFQALSKRRRKYVSINEIEVNICIFVFDILYLEAPLIDMPLEKRWTTLRSSFNEVNQFRFAISVLADSIEEIDRMFKESMVDYEGVMVKAADSPYKPSVRSLSWIKLKKDYLEGMGDSLDLLLIGAYFGKGKRLGKYGGFLMACYDHKRDVYEALCKVGTGFTDEKLKEIYEKLNLKIFVEPETNGDNISEITKFETIDKKNDCNQMRIEHNINSITSDNRENINIKYINLKEPVNTYNQLNNEHKTNIINNESLENSNINVNNNIKESVNVQKRLNDGDKRNSVNDDNLDNENIINNGTNKYDCNKNSTSMDQEILNNIEVNITELNYNNQYISNTMPSNYIVNESIKPDLWVNPGFVWEIRGAGLSRSPIYSAGQKEIDTGISMRFPRFVRDRLDKGIRDVSTSQQVANMLDNNNLEEDDIFN